MHRVLNLKNHAFVESFLHSVKLFTFQTMFDKGKEKLLKTRREKIKILSRVRELRRSGIVSSRSIGVRLLEKSCRKSIDKSRRSEVADLEWKFVSSATFENQPYSTWKDFLSQQDVLDDRKRHRLTFEYAGLNIQKCLRFSFLQKISDR